MSAIGSAVLCPRDGARLVEVERDGVMIDACPTCRGIWLDRGELEKLIAAERDAGSDFLDEVTGRDSRSGPEDGHGEEAEGDRPARRRRRGRFLENFLDLGGD